jgi:hypothetical protein
VSAHGQLTGSQVTANRDAFILGDKSIGTSQFQANGGSVVVAALDGISQVQVQAAEHAQVFAGTNAKLTATATGGNLEVVALGNLEGTFTAGHDALVAAYGAVGGGETSVSITATGGAASVFGADGVSATATGQSVTATSLEDVKGTFTATGGETGVYAGGSFDGDAVAQQSAGVTAQREVKGHVTSSYRNAWAYVWGDGPPPPPAPPPEPPAEPPPPPPPPPGNISAEVSGFANATATALSGGVTGEVKATQGNATVTARTELTGKVTAGRDARVWVIGPVSSPEIQAGRDAYVTSYAAISSPVTTTGGDANVSAGTTLSGAVTGQQSAYAQARTGDLSGDVTANVSDASAAAGGNVSGSVTGQRHALAGALGSVNGDVTATAGHASAVARGGQVTGTVTAGQSAGAFALGNITGNVYAGRDAIAATLGSSIGSVTAGRDALAVAGSAVSGPVTGGRDAGVLAFGPVSAGVNAASGDAFVVTWGVVSNSVSAGDSAFVAAGNGGSVTVSAPRDAAVVSFGPLMAFVQAGRDGYAWSAGTLTGNLQTGRDGAVISLAAASMGLATGRDAYAWTFDQYQSNIFAGRDALVVSLGDVNGGVFAGGSGLIYAVEDAIGSVTAGEYAGVVTWGDAAGPMSVKGPEGAFGWSYGDFNGFVESSAGSAFLTAYGNGIGAVHGADYAAAYVVGDWLGDIEGGDDAGGVALGNFNGNITAGASGYAISEGAVSASITAARDALVWAIGDVSGNYDAGRDAAAVAYGAYNASLTADRDVVVVWARGDLTGTITAGRNVGTALGAGLPTSPDPTSPAYAIFSYGQIDATISALNPAGLSGGGHVYPIAAWGSIDGLIEAADTIHEVRSGDAVTATLIAPNVPVPIEFDASILTQYPYPATPDSVLAEVLADAAAEYALVLATKAQVADQIADLLADFASEKASEAVRLANTIAQVTAGVTAAQVQAADALAADIGDGTAQLDAAVGEAEGGLASVQAAVNSTRAAIDADRNRIRQMRDNAYSQAVSLATQVSAAMGEADATMSESLNMVTSNSNTQKAARQAKWEEIRKYLASSAQAGWYHLPPPPDPPPGSYSAHFPYSPFARVAVMMDLGLPEYRMAAERTLWGMDAAHEGFETLGYMTPPGVLILAGRKLFLGKDLMDRQLTLGQRIWAGVDIAALLAGPFLEAVGDLVGLARRGNRVANAAGDAAALARRSGGGCFLAGTEVLMAPEGGGMWFGSALGVLALTLAAGIATRRRKGPAQGTASGLDAVSANPQMDDKSPSGHNTDSVFEEWPWSEEVSHCVFDAPAEEPWRDGVDGMMADMEARELNPWTPLSEARAATLSVALPRCPRRSTTGVGGARSIRESSRTPARLAGARRQVASKPPQSPTHFRGGLFRILGLVAGVLLAAFLAGRGIQEGQPRGKAIEAVQCGDLVPEDRIRGDHDLSLGETVDPATWRRIRLHAPKTDGSYAEGELLRPLIWLAERDVRVGGTVHIAVPECGIDGNAEVIHVGPCPPIRTADSGRVVTGVWRHQSAQVIDLYIEGVEGAIGTTANHPFWSEDRQSFVRADALAEGERLWAIDGRAFRVTSRAPQAGLHTVYNLEVHVDRVYHVTSKGVLVHNARPCAIRWHPVTNDFASKGFHLTANGQEVRLFVQQGQLRARAAFPGQAGSRAVADAIRQLEKRGFSAADRQRILRDSHRALDHLQGSPNLPGAQEAMQELQEIIDLLEGMAPN